MLRKSYSHRGVVDEMLLHHGIRDILRFHHPHDEEDEKLYTALEDGSYLFDATINCNEVEKVLGIDLDDTAFIPAARAQELFNREGVDEINVAAEEGVPALGYVVENAWLGHCLWQRLQGVPGLRLDHVVVRDRAKRTEQVLRGGAVVAAWPLVAVSNLRNL